MQKGNVETHYVSMTRQTGRTFLEDGMGEVFFALGIT